MRVWLAAVVLAGALCGPLDSVSGAAPAMAAGAATPAPAVAPVVAVTPARDAAPVGEPCPLTSPEHVARLVAPVPPAQGSQMKQGDDSAAARVGAPLAVVVALDGPPLPSGVFPVVNIDRAAGPDGGRVTATTGYPESEVRFSAPGRYALDLTVTLVARSSCGGAKARTVMERRMLVEVAP